MLFIFSNRYGISFGLVFYQSSENFVSFCLRLILFNFAWVKIYIILSSFFKNILIGYRILDWQILLFQHIKNYCSTVFWFPLFLMKRQPLFILFFVYYFGYIWEFLFKLISHVSYLCLGVFFFVFMLRGVGFLNLWVDVLHQFWKVLAIFILKYFLCTILFCFWDFNYIHVRTFHIVPQISNGLYKKNIVFVSHSGHFILIYLQVYWLFPPLCPFKFYSLTLDSLF